MHWYSFLIILILLSELILSKNLYELLEIDSSATSYQIKKAYRNLAKQYHPDKNKNPDTEAKFKDITFAYECLSDPEKRRRYDSGQGIKACEGDGGSDHFSDFGFPDIFSTMFGGGSDRRNRENKVRGADVSVELPVTLEELYNGEFVEIFRSRPVKKSKSGTRECNCRMEMKTQYLGPGRFQMIQQRVCSECPDFEFVSEDRHIEVEIEPGMPDKYVFTFPGEGEPHAEGDSGDLTVLLRLQRHPIFHRVGDDLFTNVTISLTDALVGFTFEITHLDGHKVLLKHNKVTWPGAIMRVADEGMPNHKDNSKKGNLIVTFDVAFPRDRELSPTEADIIRDMFGDGTKNSHKPVIFGVSTEVPDGLRGGRNNPILYNGFDSNSATMKHLSNVIK